MALSSNSCQCLLDKGKQRYSVLQMSYLFSQSGFLLGVGRQKMGLGGFDEELGLGNLSIIWTMAQTLESIAS